MDIRVTCFCLPNEVSDVDFNTNEISHNLTCSIYKKWYGLQINRLGRIDPLVEKYYDWNGYNFVLGNPVKFIDPFGLTPNIYYSSTGRYLGEDDDQENDNIRITDTDLFRDMQTLSGHEDNSIRSDLGMAYSMSLNGALN
ncbi:MAG: hypothetical protein IPM47_11540 [Sphingobacteriales bacterium]|nr:MAG: hypothetical protein IPM47_11540 [Sphingobacteriales bacterium]